METILFPDVEALLRDGWNAYAAGIDEIETVRASTKKPATLPAEFVIFKRVGGVTTNLVVDQPLIAYETYAATETRAHRIAQYVRAFLRSTDTINGVQFYGPVSPSGPVNLPDPGTNKPRYTGVVTLGVRGVAV